MTPSEFNAKLAELEGQIYQSIGFGSVCWEPKPTGVFDSNSAAAEGKRLTGIVLDLIRPMIDRIRELEGAIKDICDDQKKEPHSYLECKRCRRNEGLFDDLREMT